MKPDLSVLTADDLLDTAVAQADDLADIAVAESSCVGFADRSITRLSRCLVAGDGGDELSFGIGHVKEVYRTLDRKG